MSRSDTPTARRRAGFMPDEDSLVLFRYPGTGAADLRSDCRKISALDRLYHRQIVGDNYLALEILGRERTPHLVGDTLQGG